MRIIVPVKRVASLDDEFVLTDGEIDADDLEHDLNDWDRFSLQAALELLGDGEGEIVAITVGDADCEEQLRACLALGARRAVLVQCDDEAVTGDPLAVARLLAAVVARESADLVLCGAQSSDAVNGATGVALAGYLGFTRVAVVRQIERTAGGLIADRELEGGVIERLELELPALLTVQTGANEPGYATLRAIKQAKAAPLDTVAPAELGLDDAELARTAAVSAVHLAEPEQGGRARMLEGDEEAITAQIADIIKERLSA